MPESQQLYAAHEEQTRMAGASFVKTLRAGDVVLLEGPLGAGKTTFVRGMLEGLGWHGPVRSPTFNLLQSFETDPSILHADLYRVASHQGLGIEDYLGSHVCVIEWPDRASGLVDPARCWRVRIEFAEPGRAIHIEPPAQ